MTSPAGFVSSFLRRHPLPFVLISCVHLAPLLYAQPVTSLACSPSVIAGGSAGSSSCTVMLGAPAPPGGASHHGVDQREVCFTVHNVGDPLPYQVRGTLFTSKSHHGSTALLMHHGAFTTRIDWDGGEPVLSGAHPMARMLARKGYSVFTVDRLGYGDSPYPGSGFSLDTNVYVEHTHEMVAQIRDGSYRVTDEPCDAGGGDSGAASDKVVLVGASAGGLLIELYATRYHDIDGIIPMSISANGLSNFFFGIVFQVVIPQLPNDYVFLVPPEADGYSELCERALVYRPGMNPFTRFLYCGRYFGDIEKHLSPVGEVLSGVAVQAEIRATVGQVGPTPALIVYADHDALFPNADFREAGDGTGPDTVTPDIEMWSTQCNCDVEFLFQEDAGHSGWLHRSVPDLVAEMDDWLEGHGL